MDDNNYFVTPGWAVNKYHLKGNELIIFSIIYGFSQDGEGKFTGSRQYLADWISGTKKTVQTTLNSLVEKGCLIKTDREVNGVKFCDYAAVNPCSELPPRCNNYTPPVKNLPHPGVKITPHNKEDNIEDNKKDKKEGLSYERPKKEKKAGADAPVIADAMTDALDSGEAKGEETKERNPAKRENGVAPENPPAEEKSDFDVFWEAYPNKKGKGQARTAFDRALKKTNLRKILNAIEEQKQTDQWKKEKGRYIPHPATWLNGECWDDETANISSKYDYEDGGWSL